ncbi:MAG: hypothetical protein AB1Z67_07570 [Candidatus Limnocylindrales bacterium]
MRTTLAALAATTLVAASACSGDTSAQTVGALASPSLTPAPTASPSALPTIDPESELCGRVDEMEVRLDTLQAVPLTLPNRTSLEIEFEKVRASFLEIEGTDLGEREDELEDSLKRLGYRVGELKLAVEDFQTNSKPRRAAPHVEEDTGKVLDELDAFDILSGCGQG